MGIIIDGDFIRGGKNAYDDGCKAFEKGEPKNSNPYKHDDYQALQWDKGWAKTSYYSQFDQQSRKAEG